MTLQCNHHQLISVFKRHKISILIVFTGCIYLHVMCMIYTATLLRICSLSDIAILKAVKDDTDNYPVIGDVRQLDLTMQHHLTDQHYLIRIRQNRERCEETCFEVLEVLVKPGKPYVFDCLNLERYINCVCVCVCACVCVGV